MENLQTDVVHGVSSASNNKAADQKTTVTEEEQKTALYNRMNKSYRHSNYSYSVTMRTKEYKEFCEWWQTKNVECDVEVGRLTKNLHRLTVNCNSADTLATVKCAIKAWTINNVDNVNS